jgi:hypothetical protein
LFAKRTDLVWIPMALQTGGVALFGLLLIPDGGLTGALAMKTTAAMMFSMSAGYLAHRFFFLPIDWRALLIIFLTFGMSVLVIPQFNSSMPMKVFMILSSIMIMGIHLSRKTFRQS